MSDEAQTPAAQPAEAQRAVAKPAGRHFRPARVAMDRGAAARQGSIAQRAFLAFGNRDAAVAFLNTHDDALGQRPIDAAVASADGLAAAERLLAERAGGNSRGPEMTPTMTGAAPPRNPV
ncbi:DUF2384 domain-containing protein [Sphingomonas sp. RHCKR47]|uniref:antitoxin Xre/MbcA/ParS toxin-binding domain-containing protein n=1 Tax=Sphingomonas citricola TaxID=2862498 RepID=UPI001CA4A86B|nr:antitoxin Xre/MbcA/ParS toxin-binding domain-containing protein [Sphingomonas citricola]MBW6521989.1 DUF2384 domain-containing protein [Sphingomonas citricola]